MSDKLFITGATGTIGKALVEELATAGADYRICSRDPEKVAALGEGGQPGAVADFADPASLDAAMDGASVVFLLSSQHPDQATLQGNVVTAAKNAGVRHIVKVSGGSAVTGPSTGSFVGAMHAQTEQQIVDSGLAWTFLRPNYFMQNFLSLAEPIRNGKLPVPLPDQRMAIVDARDVGAVAAAILRDPDPHAGKAYDVTGPESLDFAEIARRLGAALGHDVTHVAPPVEAAVEGLKAKGAPEWLQRHVAEIMVIFGSDESVAQPTSVVQDLTGRPPRGIEDFAADHASALGLQAVR
jgi:NAD(P)H dehydrogenase (quinone)